MKDWLNIDKLEYNTYDEYKDSKIELIGNIPRSFKTNKVKNELKEAKYTIVEEGLRNYLEIGDINIKNKDYDIKNKEKLTVKGAKKVPINTILVSTVRPNRGAITYTKEEGVCVSTAFTKINMKNKYYFYYLNRVNFFEYLINNSQGSTYPICKDYDVLQYHLCVPSKKEQLVIVKFLDEKTTIIDKKIEILKKQNKLEKELEKVLINQCVTKGVDSFTKLDKDGNLIDFDNKLNRNKEEFDLYMNENGYIDSEIEWLGYIPNHYEIKRIKDLIKYVQSGTTPSSKDVETMSNQTINWFTPGDLNNNILINSKRKINQYSIDTNQVRIIKDKSILFSCVGEIGKIGISLNKTFSNQQITAIIPKKNVNLFYLYFLLKINKEYINSNAYETTLLQLNNNNLININNIIFINNLKEQLAIVKFLDNKTQMLEQKRTKREKEITLLEEYKKTLINDVVTGKIKVIKD